MAPHLSRLVLLCTVSVPRYAPAGDVPNGIHEPPPVGTNAVVLAGCDIPHTQARSTGGDLEEAEPEIPATVKQRFAPTYPRIAAVPHTVDCTALVCIDDNGLPYDVIVQTCPEDFHEATLSAAMRWTWEPATRNGNPVYSQYSLQVRFVPPSQPEVPNPEPQLPPVSLSDPHRYLSREHVSSVIQDHIPSVAACYENQLTTTPALGGKLVLGWIVTTDGTVRDVHVVSSTVPSANMTRCVVDVIGTMQFHAPEREVDIVFPFMFRASTL